MSTNKDISIVIPVYNEAEQLEACLDAIVALRLPPFEVLVVDNNSTDNTVSAASRYPFVTILHERRQGVAQARNRGFTAARGGIIARIDADTRVAPDWTTRLQTIFADDAVAAVSGAITYYDVALGSVIDAFDLRLRGWLAHKMTHKMFLLGANMAIRQSAWQAVRPMLCATAHMHEDLDLAVHLAEAGQKVVYSPSLLVGVSGRRADTSLRSFYEYVILSPQTYEQHYAAESRYMYPVILFVLINYLPLRILFKGYNPQTQRFSLRLLLTTSTTGRVNPATFN